MRLRLLAAVALGALALDLAIALAFAPRAAGFSAPLAQRLFYIHVPAAIAAYAAFTATALAGAQFLRTRASRWDLLSASAAEVGALLTTIALVTGVVWSRVEFFSAGQVQGSFAFALLADAKFVATAALWLVFLGYLALRRGVESQDARGRLSAVYGLLGFLGVPASYLASRYSAHPDFLAPGSGLSPGLGAWLAASIACWLLLLVALVAARFGLASALAPREDASPVASGPATWGERA